MKLILERKWSNESITHGVLSLEGTNFKCYTLELRTPTESLPAGIMANSIAIPCGTYNLKTAPFKGYPIFPKFPKIVGFFKIGFTNAIGYGEVYPGGIAIGTQFTDDYNITGWDRASHILANYTEDYIRDNLHLKKDQREEFLIEIKLSPKFERREGSYRQYEEDMFNPEMEDFVSDWDNEEEEEDNDEESDEL